jgi:hypothetical protein
MGKGGVGKTTVSASLGLLAARHGKRTIVCEIGEQSRLAALFGLQELGHRERELAPGLSGISIDPERSKEEWLRYQLRSSTLAGILGHSRLFQYLTAAAPGLQELVTVGKIWELAQLQRKAAHAAPYDLVLVDADHSYEACRRDVDTVLAHANVLALHDIVDAACPGVRQVWRELREETAAERDFFEFTAQYEEIVRRNGHPALGLGIAVRRDFRPS